MADAFARKTISSSTTNVSISVVMELLLLYPATMAILSMETDARLSARLSLAIAVLFRTAKILVIVCTKEAQFSFNWFVFISNKNLILQK